jgi:hypothetical protein
MRASDEPRAVCVDTCPREVDAKFNCHGTSKVPKADCDSPSAHIGYGTNPLLGRFCIPNIDKLPKDIDTAKYDNLVGQFGLDDIQEWTSDIYEGRKAFGYAILTCIVCTLLYSVLIYWFTPLVVWVSIIATGCAIVGLAYTMQNYYNKQYGANAPAAGSGSAAAQDKTGKSLLIATYVVYGLAFFYFIAICCLWKAIRVSVAILKTTAVIIIRNLKLLLMPFISTIVTMSWLYFAIHNLGYLLSAGDVTQPKRGSQLKSVTLTQEQKYMAYVHIFAFFWVGELLQAMFAYVLICGVCTWYFTSTSETRGDLSITRGFWWAIRYNFGSLAFGSFILAVVWIIRITFEIMDKQIKQADPNNAVVKVVSGCVRCCLDCFHRFVKFINENAYIQVALTGESFCPSAVAAFILALKNAATFFITNGVGSLIYLLGRFTIALGNTFIGYLIITNAAEFEEIDNPLPPTAVIFVISFMMATIFMDIFGSTSLACLQCLYADVDICNQNGQDPINSTARPKEMTAVVSMLVDHK